MSPDKPRPVIQEVKFLGDRIIVTIDGTLHRLPLSRISAKLARADKQDLETFSVSPSGYGIHWPLLDEDLSISELMALLREGAPPAETPEPREARPDEPARDRGRPVKFAFAHNNFNVLNLERSLAFYKETLGLIEARRITADDGSFVLVFLGDGETPHRLELTWMRDRTEPYGLGDNEFHLALVTDDFEAAHARHQAMGCICYENPKMGIYFIHDPDDYWVEILPQRD